MTAQPTSVAAYLKALPADRRKALEAVRKVIRANLDPKFKEGIQYGMIGYFVPHSVFPDGYHCKPEEPLPFAHIASQKNHMAVYLFCLYFDPDEVQRFQDEWKQSGKKLDMGKSCLRFKKIEDVALDVIGKAIKRMTMKKFLALYEGQRAAAGGARKAAIKKSVKKSAKKSAKQAATKTTKRKVAKQKTAAKKKSTKQVSKQTATRKKASRKQR